MELVAGRGTPDEQRFVFGDRIEIGRYQDRDDLPGILLLRDPTVSSRHCVISQAEDGRCYIRDMSRNGTRVDGRRLVPNVEVEIKAGQTISVGDQHELGLYGDPDEAAAPHPKRNPLLTVVQRAAAVNVTVLVGDIRDYTVLVQRPDSIAIQQALRQVFHKLQDKVLQLNGTVKEFRGDAILAFWEEDRFENAAIEACRAAVALEQLGRELGTDDSVWNIPDVHFQMDWALATGPVTIDSIGSDHAAGLSLIGAPVVLAFRIEKYADHETGPIVVCPVTKDKAMSAFEFRDLGDKPCKGFDHLTRVYALVGSR